MPDDEIPDVPPADVEKHEDDGVETEDFADLEPVHISDAMEDALSEIDNTSAADLDVVTNDHNFRKSTLLLLDGEITVDEWIESAASIINDKVDLPWVPEVVEQQVFQYAFKLAGKVLHGFLRGGTEDAPTDG